MVGVPEDADRDHRNTNRNVEVLVASMHLQFAQNDDGDGRSEDCTVNDDEKDPCEVFGDGSLAREVPLDCEGESQ